MKHWKQITDRMAMVCLDTQKLPQDLQIQYAFFQTCEEVFFRNVFFEFDFLMNNHQNFHSLPTSMGTSWVRMELAVASHLPGGANYGRLYVLHQFLPTR